MTEGLTQLINLGSAGAVIAVVVIFLKAMKDRDDQWQTFFKNLTDGNKSDNDRLTAVLDRLAFSVEANTLKLTEHDARVEARITDAVAQVTQRNGKKVVHDETE
jgi:2-hydroxy-3-keto-5-methylthiopentenyl-1-phosphate phosphatase